MKNFDEIRSLVGDTLKESDLADVDSYVYKKIGLFIPTTGFCKYAIKPDHSHPSYMVIIELENDESLDVKVPKNYYSASICSPNIPHQDEFKEKLNYYAVLIEKEFFESQFKLYKEDIGVFTGKKFFICHDILKILHLFAFETTKDMQNSDITLNAQSTLLVHWIIRSLIGENLDMRSPSGDSRIARIQTYIECHLRENLTVSMLAKKVNMSVANFNKTFTKECGLSPKKYLTDARINTAKKLLRRNDFTVSEIAFKCGFSNSAHFAASFHKSLGLSPSEYREKYRF